MPTSIASSAVNRKGTDSHSLCALYRSGTRPIAAARSEAGGRLLFRFGQRQGEGCITHEPYDPRDIVDANVGMGPLKLQPRLRCLKKPPRFGIAHDPLTPLLLPSRTGTYFAPEIDKCRAPDKSNGWH